MPDRKKPEILIIYDSNPRTSTRGRHRSAISPRIRFWIIHLSEISICGRIGIQST